jgi:hypothetical protein
MTVNKVGFWLWTFMTVSVLNSMHDGWQRKMTNVEKKLVMIFIAAMFSFISQTQHLKLMMVLQLKIQFTNRELNLFLFLFYDIDA